MRAPSEGSTFSFGSAAHVTGLSQSPGSLRFTEATGILLDAFALSVTLRRAAE